jgi:putative transposase
MKDLKGSSSHLMNHKLALDETFKWQGGYGVFSVSVKDLPKVRSYIVNQKKHHSDSNLENTWEPRYSANK